MTIEVEHFAIDESMTYQEVPSTKEVLLNHIFAIVSEFDADNASKVTGMFSELPVSHLMLLLGSKDLLKQKTAEAVCIIQRGCIAPCQNNPASEPAHEKLKPMHPDDSEKIAVLKEGLVANEDTDFCHPLDHQESLKVAALQTISGRPDKSRNSTRTSEELADQLYEAVLQIYPQNAPKITGMLMELEAAKMERLVASSDDLVRATKTCRRVLEHTNQWTT